MCNFFFFFSSEEFKATDFHIHVSLTPELSDGSPRPEVDREPGQGTLWGSGFGAPQTSVTESVVLDSVTRFGEPQVHRLRNRVPSESKRIRFWNGVPVRCRPGPEGRGRGERDWGKVRVPAGEGVEAPDSLPAGW